MFPRAVKLIQILDDAVIEHLSDLEDMSECYFPNSNVFAKDPLHHQLDFFSLCILQKKNCLSTFQLAKLPRKFAEMNLTEFWIMTERKLGWCLHVYDATTSLKQRQNRSSE